MKIETDAEYKLFSKVAYSLSFSKIDEKDKPFVDELLNIVVNAIDAYDIEHGYVMDEPTQESIDEHERDMNNEKNSNV
jgi:hypothetical protein